MLVPRDPEVAESPLVAVLEPGAAHHLRADQSGPVAPALTPERLDAHPGHGSEHEAGRDLDFRDPPGLTKIYLHRAGNGTPRGC
jgi:hypothetical protein